MMLAADLAHARTAYLASGRAVVEAAVLYANGDYVMRAAPPAVFVIPERLLGFPVEALDEDEATEVVEALLESVR